MSDTTAPLHEMIRDCLRRAGLDVELPDLSTIDAENCKVICMPIGLGESLREMAKGARDQVVMVRVDDDTKHSLDSWVETGAVKSRSEAAALFIREGLQVRGQELEELKDALEEVESARDRLRRKARDILRNQEAEKDA